MVVKSWLAARAVGCSVRGADQRPRGRRPLLGCLSPRRELSFTPVRAGIEGEAPTLFSRGHDAMAIGAITGVGMLFLRNPDGISHHPDEAVSAADVAAGIRALAEAVLGLGAERGLS